MDAGPPTWKITNLALQQHWLQLWLVPKLLNCGTPPMWSMRPVRKKLDTSSSSSLSTVKMLYEQCNGYIGTLATQLPTLWLTC